MEDVIYLSQHIICQIRGVYIWQMMWALREQSCVTLQTPFSDTVVHPVTWMLTSGSPSPQLVKVRGRFFTSDPKLPSAFLLLTLIQAVLMVSPISWVSTLFSSSLWGRASSKPRWEQNWTAFKNESVSLLDTKYFWPTLLTKSKFIAEIKEKSSKSETSAHGNTSV